MRKIRWKKEHSDQYNLNFDLPFGDSLYFDIYKEDGYWVENNYALDRNKYKSKKFLKLECCQKYVVDNILKELLKYKKLELELKSL